MYEITRPINFTFKYKQYNQYMQNKPSFHIVSGDIKYLLFCVSCSRSKPSKPIDFSSDNPQNMMLRSYSKIRTEPKILNRLISSNNRPEMNPQTSAPLLTNLCLLFSSGFRVSSRHKGSLLRSPVTLIPDNSFIFNAICFIFESKASG